MAIPFLYELLYPTQCGLCGLLGDAPICQVCQASFLSADTAIGDPEWRGALDGVARLYRYEGRAEQSVRRLKYSRTTSLGRPMAERLFEFAQTIGLDDIDLVVPVPIHWTRTCYRGFNQSELLSEAFGRSRVRNRLLTRVRATRPQVGLTPEERRKNLIGAFRCRPIEPGQSVLLIDDVITTGHTIGECAKALKDAGAARVVAVAFAGG